MPGSGVPAQFMLRCYKPQARRCCRSTHGSLEISRRAAQSQFAADVFASDGRDVGF
jgi:hypothetical protein